jgi:hypothetical protein
MSPAQKKMIEILSAAPDQRLRTQDRNYLRTLDALARQGHVVKLWGPSSSDSTSMYALRNAQNCY